MNTMQQKKQEFVKSVKKQIQKELHTRNQPMNGQKMDQAVPQCLKMKTDKMKRGFHAMLLLM